MCIALDFTLLYATTLNSNSKFSQMTATLTKKLGMAPGGEFRTAMLEAQKVPGCGIHLGDRELSVSQIQFD